MFVYICAKLSARLLIHIYLKIKQIHAKFDFLNALTKGYRYGTESMCNVYILKVAFFFKILLLIFVSFISMCLN